MGGRQRIQRVAHRGRCLEAAVGLEVADGEEPGLGQLLDRLDGPGCHIGGVVRRYLDDVVVPDDVWIDGQVLLADQHRTISGGTQRMYPVLAVVPQPPAAVGESIMPLVWQYCPVSSAARLPEQTGAALKAWRKSTPWSARSWMFGVGT